MPEVLVLKISTWANVFGFSRPMAFSVLIELSLYVSICRPVHAAALGDLGLNLLYPSSRAMSLWAWNLSQ